MLKSELNVWNYSSDQLCCRCNNFARHNIHLGLAFTLLLIVRHSRPAMVQRTVVNSPTSVTMASFDQFADDIVMRNEREVC